MEIFKKKKFVKDAEYRLSHVKDDLQELYCTFDETKALITVRKLIKLLTEDASKETLLQALVDNTTVVDDLIYAIPHLCEVCYKVVFNSNCDKREDFEFTRYYIAYGNTEDDLDAYLDTAIQIDLMDIEERLGHYVTVTYEVKDSIPCIK
jgi:hypothetical protein